jgi:hypothetical protein
MKQVYTRRLPVREREGMVDANILGASRGRMSDMLLLSLGDDEPSSRVSL